MTSVLYKIVIKALGQALTWVWAWFDSLPGCLGSSQKVKMLELERQSTQRETDMRSAALRRVNEEGDAMSLQMQVRDATTAVRL